MKKAQFSGQFSSGLNGWLRSLKPNSPSAALGILVFYFFFRFIFGHAMDELGTYASYALEGGFAAAVIYFYRKQFKLKIPSLKKFPPELLVAVVAGYAVYKIMRYTGIVSPFDLTSPELLLAFFVIGPLLEEAVFRQALWFPLEVLFKRKEWVILGTAAIFSFAHFYAYFYVPADYQAFVVYQTLYALILGLWWGQRYSVYRSAVPTLMLHVTFNLGFYLGFVS